MVIDLGPYDFGFSLIRGSGRFGHSEMFLNLLIIAIYLLDVKPKFT
jgi:hypothetical protein